MGTPKRVSPGSEGPRAFRCNYQARAGTCAGVGLQAGCALWSSVSEFLLPDRQPAASGQTPCTFRGCSPAVALRFSSELRLRCPLS